MAQSKRILVVDDETRVLFILGAALKSMPSGIEVTEASNGRQALERLATEHFDLIITDLFMPEVDGIELTEAVRQLDPNVPVVWITARGCYRVHDQSERLQVYRCLDKPLRVGQIRQIARQALATAGQAQEP
ncbi:MAG: response regulator [Anaerolineae bacterium]|nr:response regulator [Anaerolineae bacterium]